MCADFAQTVWLAQCYADGPELWRILAAMRMHFIIMRNKRDSVAASLDGYR